MPQNDLNFQDPWGGVLGEVRSAIASMAKQDGRRFVAILSPFMTCEEAYLLCDYLRGLNKHITLAMGEVPIVGEDDLYPKGPRGEAPAADKVKFTIRAEKCPNRLGVEAVLKRFQGGSHPVRRRPEVARVRGVRWGLLCRRLSAARDPQRRRACLRRAEAFDRSGFVADADQRSGRLRPRQRVVRRASRDGDQSSGARTVVSHRGTSAG